MTTTEQVIQLEQVKNGNLMLPEIISLFDTSNLKETFYTGYVIKRIFNMEFLNIKDTDIIKIEINMFSCAVELYKNKELKQSIDFIDSTEEEIYNIIDNLMVANNTHFLITYLGDIVQKTNN